jgi:hypothetical protein
MHCQPGCTAQADSQLKEAHSMELEVVEKASKKSFIPSSSPFLLTDCLEFRPDSWSSTAFES